MEINYTENLNKELLKISIKKQIVNNKDFVLTFQTSDLLIFY